MGIDPVYNGNYEVELDSWPWPTLVKWTKKSGWDIGDCSIIKHWRGLTTNPEEYIPLED